MECQWIKDGDKFKCQHCGFVSKRNTLHKLCETLAVVQASEEPVVPNMATRVMNFGKATAKHIITGGRHCTDKEKQARYDQCSKNECGLFILRDNMGICAHNSCGCFIRSNGKFLDKLSWASSSCPAGFWGPIEEKDNQNTEKGV